jgi:hypothetical protein
MFVIPRWYQLASKVLICKDSSLWPQVGESLICNCRQVVLFLYPTGEQGERHVHLFKVIKLHSQEKVLDVDTLIFWASCANGAILM